MFVKVQGTHLHLFEKDGKINKTIENSPNFFMQDSKAPLKPLCVTFHRSSNVDFCSAKYPAINLFISGFKQALNRSPPSFHASRVDSKTFRVPIVNWCPISSEVFCVKSTRAEAKILDPSREASLMAFDISLKSGELIVQFYMGTR